jgi:hypothetical protein
MELRNQKRTLCLIALLLAPAACPALEFPARHDHWRSGCAGILKFETDGVSFTQIGNKETPHRWTWNWTEIQQLEIGDGRMVRLTGYRDRLYLAGKDHPFDFYLDGRPDLTPVYRLLRGHLDQRFIVRLADMAGKPLWQLPVKRLRSIRGTQGTLAVFADRIVYKSSTPWASRTWRDSDIDHISTAGPFQLTVTTFEHGGTFDFQLRRSLPPEQYQALWLRLNRPKGLAILSDSKESR